MDNASKILYNLLRHRLAGVFLRHIADVSPMVLTQDCSLLLRRVLLKIEQRNCCALFGEETCCCKADPIFRRRT
jgi:hypothetical protein